jgi:paraquat-inducible protein B
LQGIDSTVAQSGPAVVETLRIVNLVAGRLLGATDDATEVLRSVGGEGRAAVATLNRLLGEADGQVAPMLGEARAAIKALDATLVQARATLGSVDAIVGPRAATRGDLDATLRNLSGASASLRSFSEQIERNPNALIIGGRR